MRGLKYGVARSVEDAFKVAPLVGAWIEIKNLVLGKVGHLVAPLVGAWIEISKCGITSLIFFVAPLVGAWIEIIGRLVREPELKCRTPRGCVD